MHFTNKSFDPSPNKRNTLIFTARIRSTRKGNVFIGVHPQRWGTPGSGPQVSTVFFVGGGVSPSSVTGSAQSPVPELARGGAGSPVRTRVPSSSLPRPELGYPASRTIYRVMPRHEWYFSCSHAGGLSFPFQATCTNMKKYLISLNLDLLVLK